MNKPSALPILALAILLVALCACGKKQPNIEAARLQHYLARIPEMEKLRIGDPLKEWDSSVEGFKKQLKDYDNRVKLLELMPPEGDSLRALHNGYVRANKLKLNAWKRFLGNYEGGDLMERMDAYHAEIAEADSEFVRYFTRLQSFSSRYGVHYPESLPRR